MEINSPEKKKRILNEKKQEYIIAQQAYSEIKKTIVARKKLNVQDTQILDKAFELTYVAHSNTYRKSGEPYVMHPIRVSQIITREMDLGLTSVLSGLLHDVLEDTSISVNTIQEFFGQEVSEIVKGLTKIKKIFAWTDSQQAENFKKLLLQLASDHRTILVKIADRLDNMRTLGSLPKRKQLKIASETIQFYVPIAHRLGLNKIKLELEDLYVKYIYPEVYNKLTKQLAETQKIREKEIDKFAKPINKVLLSFGTKFRLEKRVKSIYSIWKKMKTKKISLDKIYDLIALRIILDCPLSKEKMKCWEVLGIITSFYKPNPKRFRDWISIPKSNGYESLHNTVMNTNGNWIEVQIRTERMHEVACKGLAAHWRYKDDKSAFSTAVLDMWIKNIQKILNDPKKTAIEAIEDIQISLYEDEINVFDTKGRVKVLPEGATVLDFAIEEDHVKGLQCSSALVNQVAVPVQHKLQHGDQIELIFNKAHTPKQTWLNYVVTPIAKRVLKKVFQYAHDAMIKKGKNIIESNLTKLDISLNKKTEELLKYFFDAKTISILYYDVANKKIKPDALPDFVSFVKNIEGKQLTYVHDANSIDPKIKDVGIIVGDKQKDYKLGNCCDPIPGEKIFGVVSIHQTIKIHRIDCPNALYILTSHGDKLVQAEWDQQKKDVFLDLTIIALSQVGIRKKIANMVKEKYLIDSLIFKKQKHFIYTNLTIQVKNAAQLNKFIEELQHVQGVTNVIRGSIKKSSNK